MQKFLRCCVQLCLVLGQREPFTEPQRSVKGRVPSAEEMAEGSNQKQIHFLAME